MISTVSIRAFYLPINGLFIKILLRLCLLTEQVSTEFEVVFKVPYLLKSYLYE